MATKSAPRALLSADDRAALGQAIKDAWDDDQLDRHDWLLDLPRWMRAYQGRVEAKNVPWEGASNLNVPVTPTVIDAMHPRLMAGLLNPEPGRLLWQFSPIALLTDQGKFIDMA